MSEPFETVISDVENVLTTAEAITNRELEFTKIAQIIEAELNGTSPAELPPEQQRNIALGRTTLNILRVENPGTNLSAEQLLKASGNETIVAKMIEQMNDGEEDTDYHVTAEGANKAVAGVMSEVFESAGFDDETRAKNFRRTYEAAQQVAQENHVTLGTVYENDSFYFEACRRADTSDEYVEQASKILRAMSAETLESGLVRMLDQMLPPAFLKELSQEDISEFLIELQMDTTVRDSIEESLQPALEVIRQSLTYMFLKIYGYETFLSLNQGVLEDFAPKQAWTPTLLKLVEQ